jgi:MFS transporter, DHA1 family, tetracycline resistance protein
LKSAYILFAGLFSVNIGQSILGPVLPPLIRELGLSEIHAGLIMGISAVMWVIFSPIWGRRSEVWGRKPVFLISLVGYTLGVGTFGIVMQMGLDGIFATSLLTWILLVLARMVVGVLYSGSIPSSLAYIADTTTGQVRTNALGILSAAGSLGRIFGAAVGGIVVGIGLVAPIFLSALLPLIGVMLVLVMLPPVKPNMKKGQQPPQLSPLDSRVWRILVVGLSVSTIMSLVHFSIAFLFQDRLQLSATETAQAVSFAFVASGCAALFTQTVLIQTFQWSPTTLIRVGLPILLISAVLLVVGETFLVLSLGLFIQGFGLGFSFPGYNSAMSFSVEDNEQGAAAGLLSAVGGIGGIVGPIVGTGLYGLHSTYPYLLAVLILALGIAVSIMMTPVRVVEQTILDTV